MRLDGFNGPTIDDFPGIATSRLILGIYIVVLVVSLAVTVSLVVWTVRNRRRAAAEGRTEAGTGSGG